MHTDYNNIPTFSDNQMRNDMLSDEQINIHTLSDEEDAVVITKQKLLG